MEKNSCFGNTNCSEFERMNERQKPEKTFRLMQTALTSLWCCAGWKFPSKLRIFSLPHHPPVGLHPSQGDKQKKLFPAGTASYLCIHQVQSRSDWAAVRRSKWRIHRATIERFISVYRLEENGSLLKVPLSGCIHRKAINKTFSRQEPHLICEFIKCKAAANELQ